VLSNGERPLGIVGRWNPVAESSPTPSVRGEGCIYALDLSNAHRNPDSKRVGVMYQAQANCEVVAPAQTSHVFLLTKGVPPVLSLSVVLMAQLRRI